MRPQSGWPWTFKSDECDKKSYVFIFIMFLVIFFEFLPPTIVPIATLRSVDPKLKSLSMGLQWNILRIFGSIPGPIALGAMLDGACSVWQYICGEQGACWIYDDDKIYKAVMIVRKSYKKNSVKYRRKHR